MAQAPESPIPVAEKPARVPIPKGVRFEVFKRDGFECQYCGAHPPGTILHVDHIRPVSDGGTNDQENLITACADCNLGKGAKLLTDVPASLANRAAEIAEKEEQLRGYEQALWDRRHRIESNIDDVSEVLRCWFDPRELSPSGRNSVRRFLEHIPCSEVMEAMEVSCSRFPKDVDRAFKYFCGICWKTIREQRQ